MAPGRVPMQRPSSAVKPRLWSMLLPFDNAQRLAPLPDARRSPARRRSPAQPAAESTRCTRRTARESRSAARPRGGSRWAAEPFRRRRAGRDESWCRSRRPAARREAARTPLQSPRGCTADAAAPAGPACGVPPAPPASRSPDWRTSPRHGRRGARHRAPGRRHTGAQPGRKTIERRAGVAHRGQVRAWSSSRPPAPSLAENRGDVPMPSIWPRASRRHVSPCGRP